MHVDTSNAVDPVSSMFGALQRIGYEVGAFGKVTNDQATVLKLASENGAMTYIDSPVDYNSFDGLPYWRKFPNGSYHTESLNEKNPEFGSTYQTSQIGNRTMRWFDTVLAKKAPFFAYLGPHAPHFPAEPAPWYADAFDGMRAPMTPNYNVSSPDKTQHIRQNPPLTAAVNCWENQMFKDRWRTLLSVDDLIGAVIARLEQAGVMDKTYFIYSRCLPICAASLPWPGLWTDRLR